LHQISAFGERFAASALVDLAAEALGNDAVKRLVDAIWSQLTADGFGRLVALLAERAAVIRG